MRKITLYFLLLLSFLFSTCNLIELEEIEIKSFDKLTTASSESERSGILQLADKSYLYCGSNPDGEIILLQINEDGETTLNKNDFGAGNGNDLLQTENAAVETIYTIVASDGTTSSLINIDTLGTEVGRLELNSLFTSELGLVEKVNATAGVTYTEGVIIVGDFKQTLGGAKMFSLNLDFVGNIKWLRVYETGAIATGCLQSKEGLVFISGYFNEQLTLFKIDGEGNLQWRKTLVENSEVNLSTNLVFDAEENIVMVGGILENGQQKILLSKVSQDREIMWTTTSDSFAGNLTGTHINSRSNGNYLITGIKNNGESMPAQQILREVDDFGTVLWSSLTNTDLNTVRAHNCIETNREGCLAVGIGKKIGATGSNLQLFKTDSEGKLE